MRSRVLVVEDNPEIAEILRMGLEFLGYTVEVAQDGDEALAIANTFAPDVAVLDIGLPNMNGHAVAERLRETRALRLIALSGYSCEETLARSREAGFECHLVKPIGLRELESAIG